MKRPAPLVGDESQRPAATESVIEDRSENDLSPIDAFRVEEPLCGFQDPLASVRFVGCLAHARNIQTCLFIVKRRAKNF